ncbi:MAG: hypothetical protein JWQ47_86, partial [Glaciihabitans sp.]|nr:hypothetical protein [Glaciihabitans sp.]
MSARLTVDAGDTSRNGRISAVVDSEMNRQDLNAKTLAALCEPSVRFTAYKLKRSLYHGRDWYLIEVLAIANALGFHL